jgi:hypothetical protein
VSFPGGGIVLEMAALSLRLLSCLEVKDGILDTVAASSSEVVVSRPGPLFRGWGRCFQGGPIVSRLDLLCLRR